MWKEKVSDGFVKNIFVSSHLPFAATFVIFCTCHVLHAKRCNLRLPNCGIIIKPIFFHTICFSVSSILDLTIGFTDDGAEPHFWNVVNGKPVNAQIYCRWVSVQLTFHLENKKVKSLYNVLKSINVHLITYYMSTHVQ